MARVEADDVIEALRERGRELAVPAPHVDGEVGAQRQLGELGGEGGRVGGAELGVGLPALVEPVARIRVGHGADARAVRRGSARGVSQPGARTPP
ncbi:hypothetical protein ACFPRL_19040 [Pseudoclavibacter helvolus]